MMNLDIELRDYQVQALREIEEAYKRGLRKILMCIPTGGGKTIVFNSYVLSKNYRTLLIAHREELLTQAIDKYVFLGGRHEDCGIIKQDRWEEKRYTSSSIQTLANNPDRVREMAKRYDLVVIDEAHHTCARTYMEVLSLLEKGNPELKFLGATATPFREDGVSLNCFFEEMVYSISHAKLMAKGYLVPLRGRRIYLPVNLDSIKVDGEDFSDQSLGKLLHREEVYNYVVDKWIEYGENRRSIFFLPMVANAKSLAESFNARGIPAEYIAGSFSPQKRREVLRAFKEGRVRVLCNAMVLTEGYDDPEVDCIGIVRPTSSLVLYAQIVGRGLRIAPRKRNCMVLDFSGASKKHSLVGLEHLFGLEDRKVYEEIEEILKKGSEVSIGALEVEGEDEGAFLHVLEGNHTESFSFYSSEALDYLTWYDDKTAVLSCGLVKKVLVLEKLEEGKARISLVEGDKVKVIKDTLPEDYAYSVLTTLWKRYMDKFMREWKDKALDSLPTDKQMVYLKIAKDLGYINHDLFSLNKLSACNLIAILKVRYDGEIVSRWRYVSFENLGEGLLALLEDFLKQDRPLEDFPAFLRENFYDFDQREWRRFYSRLRGIYFRHYPEAMCEGKDLKELILPELKVFGSLSSEIAKRLEKDLPAEEYMKKLTDIALSVWDGNGLVSLFSKVLGRIKELGMENPWIFSMSKNLDFFCLMQRVEREVLRLRPPLRLEEIKDRLKTLHALSLFGEEEVVKYLIKSFPERTITRELVERLMKVFKGGEQKKLF